MDLDEILKRTLAKVNDAYNSAFDDLTEVVGKIRDAMNSASGEELALELKRVSADLSSTTFRLYVDPDPRDPEVSLVTVTHFRLPASGYPILWGTFSKTLDNFSEMGAISNKDSLLEFFADQLKEPESALVQAIGFAMRQRRK